MIFKSLKIDDTFFPQGKGNLIAPGEKFNPYEEKYAQLKSKSNIKFSFKEAYEQLNPNEIKCSYEQYKEKKKRLNTNTKKFKPVFSSIELDTFGKMCKVCFKYRCMNDLSLNRVYKLYKKLMEVQNGI